MLVAGSPEQLQSEMGGLLAFVHTPFTREGEVDVPRLHQHLGYLANAFPDQPTSYWVCCGSGEFWSLDLSEYAALVRAAVEEVGNGAPVIAGVGYGTRLALEFARTAEDQGADGLLVFPPYLVGGPQEGLLRHYARIAASTRLAIAVYHRDNAIFEPDTVARLVDGHPHVIGLKDGVGDLGLLARMRALLGERFLLMNGMPSAEMYAKQYHGEGICAYSPGGIEFVPELAWALDHALVSCDEKEIDRLIDGFYRPYTELRNQRPGYGVALVKAGLRIRGRPSGGVRPPLVDPTPEHEAQLGELISAGLSLLH
jgi:5-dehydro-4-deoxyglucarate dehydratase